MLCTRVLCYLFHYCHYLFQYWASHKALWLYAGLTWSNNPHWLTADLLSVWIFLLPHGCEWVNVSSGTSSHICWLTVSVCTVVLQRRAAMYDQSSKKVLNYFVQSDRLVTVDVTCGIAELIWHQVHHVFCELDFRPQRTVNTILLFVFGMASRYTRSTQPCIPPGSLNRVPASAGVRAGMSPRPGGR